MGYQIERSVVWPAIGGLVVVRRTFASYVSTCSKKFQARVFCASCLVSIRGKYDVGKGPRGHTREAAPPGSIYRSHGSDILYLKTTT